MPGNRLPYGRDEGIWRKLLGDEWAPHKVRCYLCGCVLSTSRLVLAAHGRKHVRANEAAERVELTDDGPRVVFLPTETA